MKLVLALVVLTASTVSLAQPRGQKSSGAQRNSQAERQSQSSGQRTWSQKVQNCITAVNRECRGQNIDLGSILRDQDGQEQCTQALPTNLYNTLHPRKYVFFDSDTIVSVQEPYSPSGKCSIVKTSINKSRIRDSVQDEGRLFALTGNNRVLVVTVNNKIMEFFNRNGNPFDQKFTGVKIIGGELALQKPKGQGSPTVIRRTEITARLNSGEGARLISSPREP